MACRASSTRQLTRTTHLALFTCRVFFFCSLAAVMKPSTDRMDQTFARLLGRRELQGRRRRLTIPPHGAVDFSSNSYLSLASNPELKKRYIELLQCSGDQFSLGSGGSRLLDGNNVFTEDLEARIAAFHNAPAGLLFNSGFDANAGLFSCAPQPGDVVVYDELIHASVHDGMKLGRARRIPFAHNTVNGESSTSQDGKAAGSLGSVLAQLCAGAEGEPFRSGNKNIFVAVEGVYSMDGDVAPLQEIVACVRHHLPKNNGHIIVDEAHSTGIIGQRGRGLVCHLGLEDQIWARVHTFGKAMGCAGGKFPPAFYKFSHTNPSQPSFCARRRPDRTSSTTPEASYTQPPLATRRWQRSRPPTSTSRAGLPTSSSGISTR